ncbi:HlyD family secretion protein [Methylophaga frappieri]|uniref:Membrane fusion protein (MFP) family protein n=1 Tax=Methylophaga frappieri (strain ATCC BAA-2434 / DSM 25690 / JAM7) TaxID=754477 RepID=I1YLB1_METFJ|nr:HlyD family type I secretion periplasmic adaptor subunit [Methylophaga frappieri]AFJ03704.1 HlyD family secretion protein [Methylophaga frappieri]
MRPFTVFWDAWKNRHTMGQGSKTRELAAFLPAALEIQEAPPNPLAKWLGRSLIILFLIGVVWACVGEVNIVASAEGKIIPSARVKQIQPLEKAVVKTILVSEGEEVRKGQPLVELDSTLTSADEKRLTSERHSIQMQLAVKQALLTALSANKTVPAEQVKLTFSKNNAEHDTSLYQQLLWQHWQDYQSQQQTLQNTLNKTRFEQAASKEIIKKLQQTLPIVTKRAEDLQSLHQQSFVTETEYLDLEQQRIEQTQDLAAEKHRLQQLVAAESEVKHQLQTLAAQTKARTLQEITEYQRQIASLDEELTKAQDLNAKQILYAPVSGQVQELAINTVGGVVTEAQQLMLIVPNAEQLEVEVFLENKDIGFIEEGMPAEIKVHTFSFTKYGVIDAKVTTVSDDATVDEKQGLIYRMQLLMSKNAIMVDSREVKLMPGMAVTAEMKTGTRRIIEFFLAPLLRHGNESLRER